MTYELIKQNFDKGLWTSQMVKIPVIRGVITKEQYKDITSSEYE